MAAALSTLQLFQDAAHTEPMCFDPRPTDRAGLSDFDRSRQSRRRYRVIASARRLTALFDHPASRSVRTH